MNDIQVVVTEAFRPALEAWLLSRGLYLFEIPLERLTGDKPDLPTYGIGIRMT